MNKMKLPLSLVGISLLLAGCSSDEKKVLNATETTEEQESEIVKQINDVTSEEKDLQKQFSETLTNDKELKSMKDSSSKVFENIDNRDASLESIQKASSELSDQADKIKDVDGKDLPEKDVKEFHAKLGTVSNSLDEWLDFYEKDLKVEKDYFTSLSSDKATYKTFSDGLEKINDQHQQSNEKLSTIDKQLSELSSVRSSVAKQLEDNK
ncbi:MAG: YkyA family protein [Pisciglobus halotolerans]|nr:YkyA family protein [Pisciglobus halotolerans]